MLSKKIEAHKAPLGIIVKGSRAISRVLFFPRGEAAAIPLGLQLPATSSSLPEDNSRAGFYVFLFGLAPDGVYLTGAVTGLPGELLPHRFTLTCACTGGLLSVALSVDHSTWGLPSVLPCGARTFLSVLQHAAATRPAPKSYTITLLRGGGVAKVFTPVNQTLTVGTT